MRRRALQRSFLVLIALAVVFANGSVAGGQSVETLRDRMDGIQDELDSATARIEELRTDQDQLTQRLQDLDARIEEIASSNSELEKRAIERARSLYMGGATEMFETLLSARDLSELSAELEYATRVSDNDAALFIRYARVADELRAARDEVTLRAGELSAVEQNLDEEIEGLQGRFAEAQDDYEALKKQLAARASREETVESTAVVAQVPAARAPHLPSGSMTCPVDAPNSFIDSWGYPRSGGRTHEGTDIMAASGAPVVAIADGTITYAGYGSSAGYWIVLTGDDGHGYWYMHNTKNLVSGGHVRVGQQIATVGNTGNASGGAPHVHFEYHPGGGGPINPYPMLRGLC